MDSDLLQASDSKASQHEPFLGSAEEAFYAHPLLEELYQAVCSTRDEVSPHSEGFFYPRVLPDRDD